MVEGVRKNAEYATDDCDDARSETVDYASDATSDEDDEVHPETARISTKPRGALKSGGTSNSDIREAIDALTEAFVANYQVEEANRRVRELELSNSKLKHEISTLKAEGPSKRTRGGYIEDDIEHLKLKRSRTEDTYDENNENSLKKRKIDITKYGRDKKTGKRCRVITRDEIEFNVAEDEEEFEVESDEGLHQRW